jgi:hypothetical protein
MRWDLFHCLLRSNRWSPYNRRPSRKDSPFQVVNDVIAEQRSATVLPMRIIVGVVTFICPGPFTLCAPGCRSYCRINVVSVLKIGRKEKKLTSPARRWSPFFVVGPSA